MVVKRDLKEGPSGGKSAGEFRAAAIVGWLACRANKMKDFSLRKSAKKSINRA